MPFPEGYVIVLNKEHNLKAICSHQLLFPLYRWVSKIAATALQNKMMSCWWDLGMDLQGHPPHIHLCVSTFVYNKK